MLNSTSILTKFAKLRKEVDTNMVPLKVTSPTGRTKAVFEAETALTSDKKRIGMAKNSTITEKDAMFFNTSGPFWMKDVPFDLDLLFLTKKGTITGKITMKAGTLDIHQPPFATKYALEITGHLSSKTGIRVGDKVSLNLPQK